MAKPSRTWDGRPETGYMSGFTAYNTDRETYTAEPAPVLSPDDLLKQIRYLRQFMEKTELDRALKLLEVHVADLNNPHKTDLDQFTKEVADIFYEAYVAEGGKGTKEYYLDALFKTLRVASTAELHDTTKENLVLSVWGGKTLLQEHSEDENAHAGLFTKMFPGTAVETDPIRAYYAFLGLSGDEIQFIGEKDDTFSGSENNKVSFINTSGSLCYFSDVAHFSTDSSQGCSLIPCFGMRQNFMPYSKLFRTSAKVSSVQINQSTIAAPDGTSGDVYSVETTGDAFDLVHYVKFQPVTINKNDGAYTFSVFVKAGTCDLFQFSLTDVEGSPITVRAIFDLHHGKKLLMNGMGHYNCEMHQLINGWYRVSFTICNEDSDTALTATIATSFFKSNNKDLAETNPAFTAGKETLGYMWGVQLENSNRPSPIIHTAGAVAYQKAVGLVIPVDDTWNTSNFTLSIKFQTVGKTCYDVKRTLFAIYDSNRYIVAHAYFDKDGKLTLARYKKYSTDGLTVNKIWNEEIFDVQTSTFSILTYGIDAEQQITYLNTSSGMNLLAPDVSSLGSKIYIGCNKDGEEALEGYVQNVLIYDKKLTEDEIIFLNGEDL